MAEKMQRKRHPWPTETRTGVVVAQWCQRLIPDERHARKNVLLQRMQATDAYDILIARERAAVRAKLRCANTAASPIESEPSGQHRKYCCSDLLRRAQDIGEGRSNPISAPS